MNLFKKYYWLLLPLISWLIVRFGFDFNGLYGQDAYTYLLHAREWKEFFLGGEQPGPSFWPPNYSLLSGLLATIVGTEFYSLQLVSLMSFTGVAWIIDRWIQKAFPQVEDWTRVTFVTLAWLLSPYIFRLGMQSMSDMLAMFLVTASFYQLWIYLKQDNLKALIFWSILSALAITSRYPTVVVLVPPMLFVVFNLIRRRQVSRIAVGLMAGMIPILLAIWWKLQTVGLGNVITNGLIYDWSLSNFFKTEFHRPDTNSQFILPNILYNLSIALQPGTMFIGIVLLPFLPASIRKNTYSNLLFASVLIYAIFLSGIPFQNSRVMSFSFPLVVMLFAPAFFQLILCLTSKNISLRIFVPLCLILQTALTARAMHPSIAYSSFEVELANWVKQNYPGETVYTSAYSQLFEAYETGNPVVQIYQSEVGKFEDGSVFIFNESWAAFKLKETMQLSNWESANNQMSVEKQKCWENGWCVYSLNSKINQKSF